MEVVSILILSVVIRMSQKPSSPVPLFSFTMIFASSNIISYRSCSSFPPSFANLSASSFPETLQWDGIHWMAVRSVYCCSVASDKTSTISISLFLVPARLTKHLRVRWQLWDKWPLCSLGATWLLFAVHLLQSYNLSRTFLLEWLAGWLSHYW